MNFSALQLEARQMPRADKHRNPSCLDCFHMKCFPGWWEKACAKAHCEQGLLEGQDVIRRPFKAYENLKLWMAASVCADFDDMRTEA